MDTEILKLMCPICGREMERRKNPNIMCMVEYNCANGHERVLVQPSTVSFVFLGDGCYITDMPNNTSCEKAIARMRKEYEWETGFTNGV